MEGKPCLKGLAPFASVEDLSDGESPPGKHRLALPGIKEDSAPGGPRGCAPPRIDISRASSSSHHDDSSPERELFAGGDSDTGGGAKLGLGFTEEMAQELRSSTEELDYHGPPEPETKQRRRKLTQQHAVIKYELDAQSEKERKDSACSDIALLSISGRTSRLSSIGSGGSAASGVSGVSHVSGGSHLSAVSQLSKASRCSSPHRTLLETSFCGPKPIPTLSLETEYPPRESVEAALLARNVDPAGAILPVEEVGNIVNGTHVVQKQHPQEDVKEAKVKQVQKEEQTTQKKNQPEEPKPQKPVQKRQDLDTSAAIVEKPIPPKPKPKRRPKPVLENELQRIIPLHSEDSLEDDSTDQIDQPIEDTPSHSTVTQYNPENGIYIPLKGPDPNRRQQMEEEIARKLEIQRKKKEIERLKKNEIERFKKAEQDRHKKKDGSSSRHKNDNLDKFNKNLNSDYSNAKPKQCRTDDDELFKIIPLHGDTPPRRLSLGNGDNCNVTQFMPWNDNNASLNQSANDQHLITAAANRIKPATLDLAINKPAGTLDLGRPSRMGASSVGREESRTPSPATSLGRGSLFRRSSESSSSSKSRMSYSAESKSKKDSRNKSVFSSLFKKSSSAREKERSKDDITGTTARRRRSGDYDNRNGGLDPKITNVEFTFNQDRSSTRNAGPDSIVIPLHSPDSTVEPLMVYDPETETMVDMHLEEEPRVRLPQTTTKTEPAHEKIAMATTVAEDSTTTRKPIPPLPQQRSSSSVSDKAIVISADVITHQEPEDKIAKKVEIKLDKTTPNTSVAVSPKSPKTTPTSSVISPRSPKTTPTSSLISPGSSQRSQLKESSPGSGELLPEVLKLLPPEMMAKSPEGSKEGSIRDGKERLSGGSDDRKNSSESEQDSDAVLIPNEERLTIEDEGDDQEKKTLVHQPDSQEDELPYVPTTLPQERSMAHPIIPIKQRVSEVKTYPIERPRSTTPINPATLDDYVMPCDETIQTWDKMQITLPRADSVKSEGRSRSPSRGKPRTQQSQKGLNQPPEKPIRVSSAGPSPHGIRDSRRKTPPTPPSPPPLPPRATTAWVSFDEVPERRRTPKRITTLPSSTQPLATATTTSYNYVNPEECSCECHDAQHRSGSATAVTTTSSASNQCGVSGSDSRHHRSYSKTRTSSASYRTN